QGEIAPEAIGPRDESPEERACRASLSLHRARSICHPVVVSPERNIADRFRCGLLQPERRFCREQDLPNKNCWRRPRPMRKYSVPFPSDRNPYEALPTLPELLMPCVASIFSASREKRGPTDLRADENIYPESSLSDASGFAVYCRAFPNAEALY